MKKTSNYDKFWNGKELYELKRQYQDHLKRIGEESSPHHAHLFVWDKVPISGKYAGLTQRQIIIELAGELPYGND